MNILNCTEREHWRWKMPCWFFGIFNFINEWKKWNNIIHIIMYLQGVSTGAGCPFGFKRHTVAGSSCPFGYTVSISAAEHSFIEFCILIIIFLLIILSELMLLLLDAQRDTRYKQLIISKPICTVITYYYSVQKGEIGCPLKFKKGLVAGSKCPVGGTVNI